MDYSYFSAPAPPYPFVGLSPAHTHPYEQQDAPSSTSDLFPSTHPFTAFDHTFSYDSGAFLPSSHSLEPQTQHVSPTSLDDSSLVSIPPIDGVNLAISSGDYMSNGVTSNGDYEPNGDRSSSEEKDVRTHARSRRKLQNRIAQRAFRQRKERHVRDLENQLFSISAQTSTLSTDNQRLKQQLQQAVTQNEILRAKSQPIPLPVTPQSGRSPSPITGPLTYSPTDFLAVAGTDYPPHSGSSDEAREEEGERLLSTGAAWDLIQAHELCRKGMVDMGDLSLRLKGKSRCNGKGSAYRESDIIQAIEESVLVGSDELI